MHGSGDIPTFDLYRELEVDPSASSDTIAAAYRSLARRFHPDRGAAEGPAAARRADRMRRLNLAHEWLTDPALRAAYDRHRSRSAPGPDPAGTVDPEAAAPPAEAPAAPAPRERPRPTRPTPVGLVRYFARSAAAIVIAFVGAVVSAILLATTSLPAIVAVVAGAEGALAFLHLAGNVAFAGFVGYLVGGYSLDLFGLRVPYGGVPRPLTIVGAVTTLGFTFGFPALSLIYLPDLAAWISASGPAGIAVVGVLEAGFVAAVVLLAAWVGGEEWVSQAALDRRAGLTRRATR